MVVPAVAVLLAENRRVGRPVPGAAIAVGLKLAVTPEGRPEAESEIAELNPPDAVVEIVLLPLLPWATDRLLGEALKAKSGVAVAVTVKAIVVVCVMPPPLAVTVTEDDPVVAALLAEKVRVELPLPGAAMEVGLKLAVTPDGKPDRESETAELNPPDTLVETVLLPEPP